MSSDSLDEAFPGGPTDIEFWGLEVPPGRTVEARVAELPNVSEIVHVTGVALGEKPAAGRHVVLIQPRGVDGKPRPEVALGTLEPGRTDQFAADFGFSSTLAFRHTGKGSVFLSGYLTRAFLEPGYGSDDDEYEASSEEEPSSDEDEDEEEAPAAIPIANGQQGKQQQPKQQRQQQQQQQAASSDGEDEEDESDEGEDEDEDEGDKFDRLLGAKSFGWRSGGGGGGGGGGNSSEGEEGEEGEPSSGGDPLDIDSDDVVAGVQYGDADDMEADSGSGEEESDDEGEEDEEDEGEDEQPAPAAAAAGAKRSAQPLTPPAAGSKKQKGEAGKAVSQSAPAKGPQAKTGAAAAAAAGAGAAEQQFMQALVAALRPGPLSLNQLGTKVKRPAGVPKYKAFLTSHADTFAVEGETVSLKQ